MKFIVSISILLFYQCILGSCLGLFVLLHWCFHFSLFKFMCYMLHLVEKDASLYAILRFGYCEGYRKKGTLKLVFFEMCNLYYVTDILGSIFL